MVAFVTTVSALGADRPDRAPGKASVELNLDQPSVPGEAFERSSHERVTFRGRVVNPDGGPAPNAVVVSSAGGKAVSGSDGSYELRVLRGAADGSSDGWTSAPVRVTAVADAKGTTKVGSREITGVGVEAEIAVPAIVLAAGGTCEPAWLPTFGANPGAATYPPFALAVYDDGRGGGPALYVGGEFDSVGGVAASRIAKWDGSEWTPLGSAGFAGSVYALATFDDGLGGGPALYVGGDFVIAGGVLSPSIAKWDGSSWSAVGNGEVDTVVALATYDDGLGGGPALYACVNDFYGGGTGPDFIAKWDGRSWSAVGSGLNNSAIALTSFDDGSGGGPALYVAGYFTAAGGVAANRIAKWDGVSWSALGSGLNDGATTLTSFDDGSGSGPALYVGGNFTTAGGQAANRIAKWNGVSWSALGDGLSGIVTTLTSFDDGSGGGPALYAGGNFTTAGGVTANRIAKWNGASWSALGSGIDGPPNALAAFDRGAGSESVLFVVGSFSHADGIAVNGITNWNGTSWSALANGMDGTVYAVTTFDDGSGDGPSLYVGGSFTSACGVPANGIARWDGTTWSALGEGLNGVARSLTVFDDGSGTGPAMFVGGEFTTAGGATANRIAKWDGSSWSALGSGLTGGAVNGGGVLALTTFDDGSGAGPALYAGGSFANAGGVAANRVARWNGATWAPLGSGIGGFQAQVNALTTFDDGTGGGPSLYVGGSFSNAGGVPASGVARWNGVSWSAVGTGAGFVNALVAFDDGSGGGPMLYAGSGFAFETAKVKRWSGSSWQPVGVLGSQAAVHSLAVFDDGTGQGPALYAGGVQLSLLPGNRRLQRWDGQSWSPVGGDMDLDGIVYALTSFDSGATSAPALIAGGSFSVSPAGDSFLALWQGCAEECVGDLDGNGEVGSADLAIALGAWGTPAADFDGDGTTSAADIAVLLGAWGDCP
jgi:hypothetical protein